MKIAEGILNDVRDQRDISPEHCTLQRFTINTTLIRLLCPVLLPRRGGQWDHATKKQLLLCYMKEIWYQSRGVGLYRYLYSLILQQGVDDGGRDEYFEAAFDGKIVRRIFNALRCGNQLEGWPPIPAYNSVIRNALRKVEKRFLDYEFRKMRTTHIKHLAGNYYRYWRASIDMFFRKYCPQLRFKHQRAAVIKKIAEHCKKYDDIDVACEHLHAQIEAGEIAAQESSDSGTGESETSSSNEEDIEDELEDLKGDLRDGKDGPHLLRTARGPQPHRLVAQYANSDTESDSDDSDVSLSSDGYEERPVYEWAEIACRRYHRFFDTRGKTYTEKLKMMREMRILAQEDAGDDGNASFILVPQYNLQDAFIQFTPKTTITIYRKVMQEFNGRVPKA